MKTAVISAAIIVAAATGCQSHHASSNPTVSANEAKAQKIVQACAAKANFITANGRKAFYACIAPPGKEAAVQACAGKAFARDGVLTKAARQKFENDLAGCIIR